MALNTVEQLFIKRWKRLDFTHWNEMDVREEFIAPLLVILGYSKDSMHDVLREQSLTLSEPYHSVGRTRVTIDYVPTIRMRHFWIIEAKSGQPRAMNFPNLLQAHLYAIHPEVQARFIVLTNGWEIRLYDALTVRSWDDADHVCTQDDCETTFEQLKEMIGAQNMLHYIRRKTLQAVRDSFAAEIDEHQVTSFQSEIHRIIQEGKHVVRNNTRALQVSAWREAEAQELSRLKTADFSTLLVEMDIPINGRLLAANEYARRIIESSDETLRSKLVDKLVMMYRGRPHAIFRVSSVFVLIRLLQEDIEVPPSIYTSGVKEALRELVTGNCTYWEHHQLANALCHLENTVLRLAKKLALHLAMDQITQFVTDLTKTLSTEDLLRNRPTVSRYMVPIVHWISELLWRSLCSSSSADEIWNGIWLYETIEVMIDQQPHKDYPDGDSDLLFFEYYGRMIDMLRLGTWDVLHRNIDLLRRVRIEESVIEFASLSREEVVAGIPRTKTRPMDWVPEQQLLAKVNALVQRTR